MPTLLLSVKLMIRGIGLRMLHLIRLASRHLTRSEPSKISFAANTFELLHYHRLLYQSLEINGSFKFNTVPSFEYRHVLTMC